MALALIEPVVGRRGGWRVYDACRSARRRGVVVGASAGEVLDADTLQAAVSDTEIASADGLRVFQRDDAADRLSLERLAGWCERYGPWVGIAEPEGPEATDTLLIDVTGCGAAWRGEDRLARRVVDDLAGYGLRVRAVIAGSVGAAWACVRWLDLARAVPLRGDADPALWRRPWGVVRDHRNETLAPLPVAALRLDTDTRRTLASLGVEQIGQLRRLPRAELACRFGGTLLTRLDQADGRVPEPVVPVRRPEPVRATWEGDEPIHRRDWLVRVVADLLAGGLRQTRPPLGVAAVSLRLIVADEASSADRERRLQVRPRRIGRDAGELLDLLRLRLEREPLGPVRRIDLALTGEPMPETPAVLLPELADDLHDGGELDRLFDRLAQRLGSERVGRIELRPHPLPERSWRFVPLDRKPERPSPRRQPLPPGSRPTRWTTPLPVRVTCDDGRPTHWQPPGECGMRRLTHQWGPERIGSGWWEGVVHRRDYWRVQDAAGGQFWLFRDLAGQRWCLHGWFE